MAVDVGATGLVGGTAPLTNLPFTNISFISSLAFHIILFSPTGSTPLLTCLVFSGLFLLELLIRPIFGGTVLTFNVSTRWEMLSNFVSLLFDVFNFSSSSLFPPILRFYLVGLSRTIPSFLSILLAVAL